MQSILLLMLVTSACWIGTTTGSCTWCRRWTQTQRYCRLDVQFVMMAHIKDSNGAIGTVSGDFRSHSITVVNRYKIQGGKYWNDVDKTKIVTPQSTSCRRTFNMIGNLPNYYVISGQLIPSSDPRYKYTMKTTKCHLMIHQTIMTYIPPTCRRPGK